ncbi:DMT family transporter [Ketobacter sp.]|uniref:DMT family transporter n=1 Tax=Ketobacter sp. TaxID=2083498 RepID=UPI0025C21DC3|nr:DMT family transporter [Ketobacter sp.]
MNVIRAQGIAIVALLATGFLLGLTTNLVKVADRWNMAPTTYLTWSMMGASVVLLGYSLWRRQIPKLTPRTLEYFLVSSLLTTVAANIIFFNAVPRLGASFVAMLIALPPLLTYAGALMFRMERFCWWRALGVLSALVGTAILVMKQWLAPGAETVWIILTLFGPVLLALGNLYRSRRWPPGVSSEALAPGMLIMGTGLLVVYSFMADSQLQGVFVEGCRVVLIAVQSVVFAGQFLLMFVVQKQGGPVLISMIGAVSAIFGVPISMGLLGEPVLPGMVVSALLVAGGIICLVIGARRAMVCVKA